MKILLDLQGAQTESRYRGIGRQTRALGEAIIRAAGPHDVHILLNNQLGYEPDSFNELLPPNHIHRFDTLGAVAERDRTNLWRTYAAEHLREAKIAELAPDILHIGSLFEGFVDDAVTSIGRFDVPYATAVTLHDLIPLTDPGRYLAEEGPRLHWLRRAQYLKRADLLLSVSDYSRQEAMSRLHIPGDRIAVISAGVEGHFDRALVSADDEREIRRRYALDGPYILYVGAIDPRKNVGVIFEAFAKLPEALRQSRQLAFAGRLFEEEMASLRLAAARCGVPSGRLRFCQHVSERDLAALYAGCEVFVFPSTHEGFGLPALEAMACGAISLVAGRTSLPEVVGDARLTFDPYDADNLASLLVKALTDPAYQTWAKSWGRRRAFQFSWASVAERAIGAFEALQDRRSRVQTSARSQTPASIGRKPLMAFVSPLPGDRSGIADYSAELLPELARFYEIECITSTPTVESDWIKANYVLRNIEFLKRNSKQYDRILYSVGNSHLHAETLNLLLDIPGVIVLHDFFLSDLIDWMSSTGARPYEDFLREAYRSHGLTGLLLEKREGRLAAVSALTCNASIFEAANGVIVHSRHSVECARQLYGDATADRIAIIPHLRAVDNRLDRAAARRRLGLGAEEFVVCSFGVITERKLSQCVAQGWTRSETGRAPGARLVFVGENGTGDFGAKLTALARASSNISVTGYAPAELYRDYLAAADMAIQLRSDSRGETSGAVLDCLAAGTPLVVNAHGAMSELPDDIVFTLPEHVTPDDVAAVIDRIARDRPSAASRAREGLAYVADHHHPALVGEAFHAAIEGFETADQVASRRTLMGALSEFVAPIYPREGDVDRLAEAVGRGRPRVGLRQILYDVTVLAESDARTGIQRVVRGMLINLIERPPPGYRIEPVRIDGGELKYARRFVADRLDLPAWVFEDEKVDFDAGDLYLSIDWAPDRLPDVIGRLTELRRAGGRVVIGVHDLLPLQMPEYFPDYMPTVTGRWFESALAVADQLVCVSRTVADDVARFGNALRPRNGRPIAIDYFHNAADLDGSVPTKGRPADAGEILDLMKSRRSFLMVGTVEPRKGHAQVLEAFDRLWSSGADPCLVIVGKKGWMMDPFIDLVQRHPEYGKRLLWLHDISDEFLEDVYGASEGLIAASMGEGFGLPIIEAMRHGKPVIARDIPVFREVAGDGGTFFRGGSVEIAGAISEWLRGPRGGPRPPSIKPLTWRQSADQLIDRLMSSEHYRVL